MYSFRGENEAGIEVYETSEEVKAMPYKQRMETFVNIMRNEYAGRTARFNAGGDVYYAKFDEADLRKNVYGDKKSSPRGWKAKINTGADGSIFELVENAQYSRSGVEQGKQTAAHQEVSGWDYFVKTVQIDGRLYDLLANVRKKPGGEFVYSIQLNENKNKAPALPRQYQNGTAEAENRSVRVPTDAFDANLAQDAEKVKEKFSMRDTVEETGDLLAFHNITPKLLMEAINRKSLLMPSLAVTNKGMNDFGEISLVFTKDTIDPSVSEKNKLYGADAWTPTQTQLKKNAKFDTNKTVAAVNSIKDHIGKKHAGELFGITAKRFQVHQEQGPAGGPERNQQPDGLFRFSNL